MFNFKKEIMIYSMLLNLTGVIKFNGLFKRKSGIVHFLILVILLITHSAQAQVCSISSNAEAQLTSQVWWAGNTALGDEWTIDFSSSNPVLTNAATAQATGHEGTATYTNVQGDLLLYSDGISIWDGQTNVQIASNIGAGSTSTQAASIVPIPGADPLNDFYVFWNGPSTSPFGYIKVDLQAGVAYDNTVLSVDIDERMTVIPHGNLEDYWLVVTRNSTIPMSFLVYKVDATGVSLVHDTQPISFNATFNAGTVVFSLTTNKLGFSFITDSIWLADFDVDTGVISNFEKRVTKTNPIFLMSYGLAFSPNGNRLYTNVNNVANYHDLTGPVENLTVVPGATTSAQAARLAIDGKIYYAQLNDPELGVVSDPDGIPSWSTFSLGTKSSGFGLPNASYASCEILAPTCLTYDTSWDLTYTTYNGIDEEFSISNEVPGEGRLFFNDDGTRLFVLGDDDFLYQYDLSDAYDVSSASYANISVDINSGTSPVGSLRGMYFKADGSGLYVVNSFKQAIEEFTISNPWDITSISYNGIATDLDVASEETNPTDLFFRPDGKRLFVIGTDDLAIVSYDLTVAWDITSATYNGVAEELSVGAQESSPSGLFFQSDGSRVFIVGQASNSVVEYLIDDAWDLSSASYNGLQWSIIGEESATTDIYFTPNGKRLFAVGGSGKNVVEYNLGLINFSEAKPADMGKLTIGESLRISIENDTFANAGGSLTHGVDFTITNLPVGLTATLDVATDGLSARLNLTGTTSPHYKADSIADLQFSWADSAFTATEAINLCTGSGPTSSNVGISFNNGTDYSDAVISYGTAGHGNVAAGSLYIGLTPADGDPEFIITLDTAMDDDGEGIDDEDVVSLDLYQDGGGMQCIGDLGTYTTAQGEYCIVISATNTTGQMAQVVGWLDYGDGNSLTSPNGKFDANERSITNPTGADALAVDDGTFTTGNLPSAGTSNLILVFSGLGVNFSQSSSATVIRLRVSTDSSFFTDLSPSPTGDLPDGEVEDQRVEIGTLPVELNFVDSSIENKEFVINWETGSEMYNIGFNLFAKTNNNRNWQSLSPTMTLTPPGNSAEPRRYTMRIPITDELKRIRRFIIASMDANGVTDYFGPFEFTTRYGQKNRLKPIKWARIRQQLDKKMNSLGYLKAQDNSYYQPALTDQVDQLTPDKVMEFQINQDGLYRINSNELPSHWQSVPLNELAIIDSYGNAVARDALSGNVRRADYPLGENGKIIFYGKTLTDDALLYSERHHYRLIRNKQLVKPIIKQTRQGITQEFSPYHWKTQIIEQNNRYLSATTTSDPWIMEVMTSFKRRAKVSTHLFNIEDALLDKGLKLSVSAGRITEFRAVDNNQDGIQDPEYKMTGLVFDGEREIELDQRFATGRGLWNEQFIIPASTELKPDNQQLKVGIKLQPAPGYRINQMAIDHVSLTYASDYYSLADDKYLSFKAPDDNAVGYQVFLNHINSYRVNIYAAWDSHLALIRPEQRRVNNENPDNISMRIRFGRLLDYHLPDDDKNRPINYWVAGQDGYLSVSDLREKSIISQSSLLTMAKGVDYLIVAHPSLMGEDSNGRDPLDSFKQHKETLGHSVAIVDYLQITDAFGNGQPGTRGLSIYLNQLASQGHLKYVLLVGGSSYDHKDILNTGSISLIPPYYKTTHYFSNFTNTDTPYVVDVDNGRLFASIGRWPARTIDDISNLLDKQLRWHSEQDNQNKAIFMAQQTIKHEQINFQDALEILKRQLDSSWTSDEIYVQQIINDNPDLDLSQASLIARQQVLDSLNNDHDLVIFNGHANSTALSKPVLLHANDMKNLNPNASIWLPLSCYVTYYESPHVNTLAYQLMFNGPALSISGATSYSDQNLNLNMASGIMGNLIAGKSSLGFATEKTLENLGNDRLIQYNWATLGDPALLLNNKK